MAERHSTLMPATPRSPGIDCTFRPLRDSDYPGLLALQEANLRDNLPQADRTQGFLSARFSREQFAEMNDTVAIVVADIDASVAGYLCGSTIAFNRSFALLAAMIQQYPFVEFRGRTLDRYASFVDGPVCIDRRFRGKGLLRGLYRALMARVAGRFEIGVGFIAQDNSHSLAAHVQGLGMTDAGRFDFNERAYRILAFAVDGDPS